MTRCALLLAGLAAGTVTILAAGGFTRRLRPRGGIAEAAEEYEDLVAEVAALREMRRVEMGLSRVYPNNVIQAIMIEGENRVRVMREWRGLTQAELAERAGTSHAYVSRIETGHRHPGRDLVRRLAAALDVDAELLLSAD